MKRSIGLFFSFLSLTAFGQESKLEKRIFTSSSQLCKAAVVTINNVNFDVVLDKTDTVYMQTNDRKFITKEGFSIGQKFSDLPLNIRDSLKISRGWAYYYTLPSGWSLGFCEGESSTENYPNADSKIDFIFKRKQR